MYGVVRFCDEQLDSHEWNRFTGPTERNCLSPRRGPSEGRPTDEFCANRVFGESVTFIENPCEENMSTIPYTTDTSVGTLRLARNAKST